MMQIEEQNGAPSSAASRCCGSTQLLRHVARASGFSGAVPVLAEERFGVRRRRRCSLVKPTRWIGWLLRSGRRRVPRCAGSEATHPPPPPTSLAQLEQALETQRSNYTAERTAPVAAGGGEHTVMDMKQDIIVPTVLEQQRQTGMRHNRAKGVWGAFCSSKELLRAARAAKLKERQFRSRAVRRTRDGSRTDVPRSARSRAQSRGSECAPAKRS